MIDATYLKTHRTATSLQGKKGNVSHVGQQPGVRADWIRALLMRRGFNRTVVALANKMARAAWAMLTRQEQYRIA
jgi:transposase